MQQFTTHSERETEALAETLCRKIGPGSLVLFTGEMGAGKTSFVRGALRAYGNNAFVSSPTFALVNDYGGMPHVYHFDMYRVTDENDLYSTGFFDYADENSILFIEWSENVRAFIEDGYKDAVVNVDICKTDVEDERVITVEGGAF